MIWLWFFSVRARGRCIDRFYSYIGFGQYLIPDGNVLPSVGGKP